MFSLRAQKNTESSCFSTSKVRHRITPLAKDYRPIRFSDIFFLFGKGAGGWQKSTCHFILISRVPSPSRGFHHLYRHHIYLEHDRCSSAVAQRLDPNHPLKGVHLPQTNTTPAKALPKRNAFLYPLRIYAASNPNRARGNEGHGRGAEIRTQPSNCQSWVTPPNFFNHK